MPPVTFGSLRGTWRRRSIRWPDGREDTTTLVYWVQASPHYADLRLPAGRPAFGNIASLPRCDAARRAWLATQQGFAGTLQQENDAWLWRRELDFQPPTGQRDIGRLKDVEDHPTLMIEEGVEAAYTEVWEHVDDGSSTQGEAFVLRLDAPDSVERGYLVAIGDHFLFALSRRVLPPAPTLEELLSADPSAHDSVHLLDMELSFGERRGQIGEWTITHSTFPWREGQPLFAGAEMAIDWRARRAVETRTQPRVWTIVEPAQGELHWVSS